MPSSVSVFAGGVGRGREEAESMQQCRCSKTGMSEVCSLLLWKQRGGPG